MDVKTGAKGSTRGLLRIYFGDCEAATTSAIGLGVRAAGHGFRVFAIRILGGGALAGEINAAKHLPNFELSHIGEACPVHEKLRRGEMTCSDCGICSERHSKDKSAGRRLIATAKVALDSGRYDMVILDNIWGATETGMIDREEMMGIIGAKQENTELVLTGRKASAEILKRADVVTEVQNVRRGSAKSRLGIEY